MAYAILFRPEAPFNATREMLLNDLGVDAELRGTCKCSYQATKQGSAAEGRLFAVSIRTGNLLALEALLNAAADSSEHEDDQAAVSKNWYRTILAGCDDYQSDNALFVGIAKDLVSATIRGR